MSTTLIVCVLIMSAFAAILLYEVFRKKRPPAPQKPATKPTYTVGVGIPLICPICHSLLGGGRKCRCPQSESPPPWTDEKRKKNVTHYRSIDDEWNKS